MIQYTLNGPHMIVLLPGTDAAWYNAHRDEFLAVAQKRANDTWHVCEIFASDFATVLDQVEPGAPS